MQIRTPKRYNRQTGRRNLFGGGCLSFIRNLILIGLFIVGGNWVYNNPTLFRDRAEGVWDTLNNQGERLNEAIPRQPTPTPDVSDAYATANNAYQIGDFGRAIQNYEDVLGGRPNDLDAHTRLAMLLIITSDLGANEAQLNQALEVAEKAINANPEASDGWTMKAMALTWLERFGESIAYAQRALEINPNDVQAKAVLAENYWRLGALNNDSDNQDLALATINEAVDLLRSRGSAPSEVIAMVFRTQGYILERLLEREPAIQAYETARQAAPSHSYIAMELALSYSGNGQAQEAIALLDTALQSNPRDTVLLFQLGKLYVFQGNGEAAQDTFQQCINADPSFAECYAWIGGLQFYAQNYASAIQNLELAIENGTGDIEAYWQLGRAYFRTLRCELAVPVLQDGYRLAAQDEDVELQDQFAGGLADCNASIPIVGDANRASGAAAITGGNPTGITSSENPTVLPSNNAAPSGATDEIQVFTPAPSDNKFSN